MDEVVARTERRRVETEPPSAPPTAPRKKSRLGPALALIVLILLAVGAWRLFEADKSTGRRPPQETQQVGAAEIGVGDINDVITGLGTVTPLATITVQTQINGQLLSVGFKEGQIVQKGDFLAQIDPRPFQAALDTAEGTLAHDQGLLKQAESDLKRFETLGKQDSIALQQVADQEFLVEQDKGTVAQDQGTIETDKLNLTYCHIVAPVTGRVGLRLVDPGNYVQTTSTTGLVVLTQLQPISVIFIISEDDVEKVWPLARAGKPLTVTAYNRTGDKEIATGTLESFDNEIDTTTGTVKLRATFPNADEAMFPNQFVNARLLVQTLHGVTVAPVSAVQHGAPGAFVYRIKPDGTVAVQVVKTGLTDGDRVQIISGVSPRDQVVVDGADRLRDGTKVRVVPDQANPAATANPDGGDSSNGEPPKQGRHKRSETQQGETTPPPAPSGPATPEASPAPAPSLTRSPGAAPSNSGSAR
jgi:membrane fusion protein, multidrug efflux system